MKAADGTIGYAEQRQQMSEQSVHKIPEDFTVRCHDCGGTQIWKRVNAGEIETYHGCFNGKQSREAFATLTAERDVLAAKVNAIRGAYDKTSQSLHDAGIENTDLKAQVARLSANTNAPQPKEHHICQHNSTSST